MNRVIPSLNPLGEIKWLETTQITLVLCLKRYCRSKLVRLPVFKYNASEHPLVPILRGISQFSSKFHGHSWGLKGASRQVFTMHILNRWKQRAPQIVVNHASSNKPDVSAIERICENDNSNYMDLCTCETHQQTPHFQPFTQQHVNCGLTRQSGRILRWALTLQ